jgi:hypothetical protein
VIGICGSYPKSAWSIACVITSGDEESAGCRMRGAGSPRAPSPGAIGGPLPALQVPGRWSKVQITDSRRYDAQEHEVKQLAFRHFWESSRMRSIPQPREGRQAKTAEARGGGGDGRVRRLERGDTRRTRTHDTVRCGCAGRPCCDRSRALCACAGQSPRWVRIFSIWGQVK